jgi:ABC-type branched-subunit amino acid transport system substrate-binding protein
MRSAFALLLSTTLIASCVGPPREVVRGGRRVAYERAMEQDLEAARRAIQGGRDPLAQEILERFVMEFGASSRRAEARMLLADVYARGGDMARAARTWRDVAEADSRSSLAGDARLRGAEAYRALSRPEVARRFLEGADFRRAPQPTRARMYRLLADLSRELGDYPEAVRALALARNAAQEPNEWTQIDLEVGELIGERLTDAQLADLVGRVEVGLVEQRVSLELARRRIASGQRDAALAILDRLPAQLGEPESALRLRLREQARSESAGLPLIGVALPLSGEYAAFGRAALRGFSLGLDLFGPRPTAYRVAVRDTGGDTQRAGAVVQDLVRSGVRCIVGPMRSSEAVAAAPVAESARVPLITLARREDLARGSFVFRTATAQVEQARALAEFAVDKLDARRFAILYPRDSYGTDFKNLFWDEVERVGGKIVAVEAYPPDAVDIQTEIRKLLGLFYLTAEEKTKVAERDKLARRRDVNAEKLLLPEFANLPPYVDFDAIFIPDVAANAGVVLPQLRFYDVRDVALLGPSDWNDPVLAKLAPTEAQDTVFVDSFYTGSASPAVQDFVARYRAAYGDAPDAYAAEGFDAARMLGAVAGGATTPEALARALRSVPAFPAVAGLSGFDQNGAPIKKLYFLTVERGQIREYTPGAPRRSAAP